MRRIFSAALFLLFLLIPAFAIGGAQKYYVSQNGLGSQNGVTPLNAWSVNDFNNPANWNSTDDSFKIDPGDTVYFSGTIKTTVKPQGSGIEGKNITLDGYENGDCDPINFECTSSAIVDSIGTGLDLNGCDYMKVQDLRIKNVDTGILHYSNSYGDICNNITISRVLIDTAQSQGIKFTTGNVNYNSGNYITIEDSVIVDVAYGSTHSGVASITVFKADDTVIRRNHIYNRPNWKAGSYNGTDGLVLLNNKRFLIEYNVIDRMGEDCIDVKNDSDGMAHGDYIIRFNVLKNAENQTGLTIQDEIGSGAYVYGNLIYGTPTHNIDWYGIMIIRGYEDIAIWSNVIYYTDYACIGIFSQDDERPVDNVYIYNNTLALSGQEQNSVNEGGIKILNAKNGNYEIKNNIFVDNNIKYNYDNQFYISSQAATYTTVDYNLYYTSVGNPFVNWNGTKYPLYNPINAVEFTKTSGQELNGDIGNPYFKDYTNRDFSLTASSSLAINKGVKLKNPNFWKVPTIQGVDYSSQVRLDLSIDPNNTDWETIPPTVSMVSQNDFGSGWERGAYVYIDIEKPQVVKNVQAINPYQTN
jgi:hypothetical protein